MWISLDLLIYILGWLASSLKSIVHRLEPILEKTILFKVYLLQVDGLMDERHLAFMVLEAPAEWLHSSELILVLH